MNVAYLPGNPADGQGFTLIEVALVLLVLTLLLGGLLVPLGTQFDNRNIAATQKQMDEIKEALVGYALNKTYLPCPDTDEDGTGNRSEPPQPPGTCAADEGSLPWVELGLGEGDAWGSRFIYRVTPDFSNSSAHFSLASNGTIKICSASVGGACPTGALLANDAVVVLLSAGKNRGRCGNPPLITNCGTDEQENLNGNNTFVMRPLSGARAGNGEFDDLVVWLSPYTLFNRMVAAGLLTTAAPPPP